MFYHKNWNQSKEESSKKSLLSLGKTSPGKHLNADGININNITFRRIHEVFAEHLNMHATLKLNINTPA